jgi:hypothetical protein
MPTPVKAVYVVSTPRSGSTLLGRLLELHPHLAHVGELAQVWNEGLLNNFLCGCGTRFQECEHWQRVLGAASVAGATLDAEALLAAADEFGRTRRLGALVTRRGRANSIEGMSEFTRAMVSLYRGVQEITGARVVVDTSKTPIIAWYLAQNPDVDLRILHLTRDPRAVAFSSARERFDRATNHSLPQESALRVGCVWTVWNAMARLWWSSSANYLHVRYEDLSAAVDQTLDRICTWLGEDARGIRLLPDHSFLSRRTHTIAGNPMRFRDGRIRVRPDDQWRSEATRSLRSTVTAVALPMLTSFGYPLAGAANVVRSAESDDALRTSLQR